MTAFALTTSTIMTGTARPITGVASVGSLTISAVSRLCSRHSRSYDAAGDGTVDRGVPGLHSVNYAIERTTDLVFFSGFTAFFIEI